MAETRKKRTGRASEIAAILGVRDSTVSRWRQLPDFPKANDNIFVLDDVFRWFYRREAQTELATSMMESGGDSSEGLERYRMARAQQEEIRLAQIRGEVVALSDFEATAQAIFSPLRGFSEALKRSGQTELLDHLDEANKQVLMGLERLYGINQED